MANRKPPSKNVIYDSINDTGSGRKRAVEFTGGVSVAERARLFGAQVNHTTVSKPTKPDNQNQQRIRTNSSDQNYSYSSTEQRPPNNHRSAPPPQNYDRPNRNEPPPSSSNRYRSESPSQNYDRPSRHHQQQRPPPPPSSSIQSQDYSTVNRSQRQQQQPKATYQSVVYSTAQRQNHSKPSHTSVPPGESFTTDDEIYYESQRRQQRRQQKQQRHISPPSYNSNYFQPIRDPLEVLYTQPSFGYSQPSLSTNTSQSTEGLQPFDLGNLIGRIQQDYIDNARPYVSSIQFIDSPQTSSTLGLNSSTGNQTNNNLYLRPGAAYQYDVIDTSKFIPTYVKPVPGQYQHRRQHHHGSSRRRQHRGHYRDRASSPIDVMEKEKTPSPPPKPSTPIEEKPETPEETEEDETVNTKTEEKTAEDGTSEEEEDEDEEEEEEEKKPAPVVPPVTASIANPRPPPITEQNDSSSSESEETESDSDSDSDDSDDSGKKKKKKKVISKPPLPPTPAPAPAATPARTNVRATPQLNSRGAAVEPGTPVLKKITNNNTDDPPEVSTSTKSFNTQEQEKSGIRGKFSALASKFRRKKS